jgi:hypothetical protein
LEKWVSVETIATYIMPIWAVIFSSSITLRLSFAYSAVNWSTNCLRCSIFSRAGQTGIFHYKLLIFKDKEGNVIAAEGSANETEPAYTVNGERIVVFYSWRDGDKERVADLVQSFERIWSAEHPDFEVFSLPEAVYRAIVKFEPKSAP